jgi:hypothetical protein
MGFPGTSKRDGTDEQVRPETPAGSTLKGLAVAVSTRYFSCMRRTLMALALIAASVCSVVGQTVPGWTIVNREVEPGQLLARREATAAYLFYVGYSQQTLHFMLHHQSGNSVGPMTLSVPYDPRAVGGSLVYFPQTRPPQPFRVQLGEGGLLKVVSPQN